MTNRIDATLSRLRAARRTALVPFVTVGYPDVDSSEAIARAIVESGGDMLELGVPFSDALADGPTIQRTSFRALQQGVNLSTCLALLGRLRQGGVQAPILFMGYYNPFRHYGLERFVQEAAGAGLDGLIVPDLPMEEAGAFKPCCEKNGIWLVPLLAPTSTEVRIAQACRDAKGFIYCVSLTGVTGARSELATGVRGLVERIRKHTDLPVLVGFGVSRREHVEAIGRYADGAAVGSALLDAVGAVSVERAAQTAGEFVRRLKGGSLEPIQ